MMKLKVKVLLSASRENLDSIQRNRKSVSKEI